MTKTSVYLRILHLMVAFAILFHQRGFAQKDSSSFSISGYLDAYCAHYTDSVGTGNYQQFPSVSPRSNSIGLNIALITAQYDARKVRGLVTLQYGDIPRSTWSPTLNNIMEAHLGFRVCKKLWIDGGLFRTHFGTEGLLPKENIASSISVNTFYEPYYESGIKLNYSPCTKLAINLLMLNGYNIYEDNNRKKSFGALITYAFCDSGNIGYSNYIGDDSPDGDSVSHLRVHQNLFVNYTIHEWQFQAGVDYGMQKNASITNPLETATMYSGVVSAKYRILSKLKMYGRYEFFNDPNGFMSGVITNKKGNLTGYKEQGITGGIEFLPTSNSYIRLEARNLQMDREQEIFHYQGENKNTRFEVMINTGISF